MMPRFMVYQFPCNEVRWKAVGRSDLIGEVQGIDEVDAWLGVHLLEKFTGCECHKLVEVKEKVKKNG